LVYNLITIENHLMSASANIMDGVSATNTSVRGGTGIPSSVITAKSTGVCALNYKEN